MLSTSVSYCLECAAEARVLARDLTLPAAKRLLLEVARGYEAMAKGEAERLASDAEHNDRSADESGR